MSQPWARSGDALQLSKFFSKKGRNQLKSRKKGKEIQKSKRNWQKKKKSPKKPPNPKQTEKPQTLKAARYKGTEGKYLQEDGDTGNGTDCLGPALGRAWQGALRNPQDPRKSPRAWLQLSMWLQGSQLAFKGC